MYNIDLSVTISSSISINPSTKKNTFLHVPHFVQANYLKYKNPFFPLTNSDIYCFFALHFCPCPKDLCAMVIAFFGWRTIKDFVAS